MLEIKIPRLRQLCIDFDILWLKFKRNTIHRHLRFFRIHISFFVNRALNLANFSVLALHYFDCRRCLKYYGLAPIAWISTFGSLNERTVACTELHETRSLKIKLRLTILAIFQLTFDTAFKWRWHFEMLRLRQIKERCHTQSSTSTFSETFLLSKINHCACTVLYLCDCDASKC